MFESPTLIVQSFASWLRTESAEAGTLAAGRPYQEDGFAGNDVLWAVADGMGGHRDGNVASLVALKALCANITSPADEETIYAGFTAANNAVLDLAEYGEYRPPGSTLVAAVQRQGGGLYIASTGDSRVYAIALDGTWEQITDDHADIGGGLTAYLGDPGSEGVHVDIFPVTAGQGLRVLLCTDGLFGHLEHGELEALLSGGFKQMVTSAAETSRDNVTAVLLDVDLFAATTLSVNS
jgi:serine/threonine protein phosphatase PrpC